MTAVHDSLSVASYTPSWVQKLDYCILQLFLLKTGSGIDRLFEGDDAPSDPFEDLLIPQSGNTLGKAGAERLLGNDYVVILTDPRPKSSELRLTIPSLTSLPKDLLAKLIVVNADSPAENRR